jgi:hypothetical protein
MSPPSLRASALAFFRCKEPSALVLKSLVEANPSLQAASSSCPPTSSCRATSARNTAVMPSCFLCYSSTALYVA